MKIDYLNKIPLSVGRIHFIGVGGIGMSGIAEVMCNMGYEVSGSDIASNANTDRLTNFGAKINIGHQENAIHGAGVIVVSSAIRRDNVELIAARKNHIPVVKRAEMLAELMRFKRSIAIAGTHGKTTTTSLVAQMLVMAGYDPTIINGGILNALGTNAFLGQGDWLVAEADESDGSFLNLPADIAIVTNIDPEHLDHYGDFKTLKQGFRKFIENIPFYGFGVLCYDHEVVREMIETIEDRRIISYGLDRNAMVCGTNLKIKDQSQYFDVLIHDKMIDMNLEVRDICLPIAGRHNVQNALAAIAVAYGIGIPIARIKTGFMGFKGVKRRFTQTGEVNGVKIIDDYGHHPVEIMAVLNTARSLSQGKIYAVVQPHRYTRLRDLFDDFATCFTQADHVILAPVYAAGETPIEGISSIYLAEKIRKVSAKSVDLIETEAELAPLLFTKIKAGDMIICLGAGSITKWANDLPKQLEDLN